MCYYSEGRCSAVDFSGHVLCDIYSKPAQEITDYRTVWSGLKPSDMENAIEFDAARNMVLSHLKVGWLGSGGFAWLLL